VISYRSKQKLYIWFSSQKAIKKTLKISSLIQFITGSGHGIEWGAALGPNYHAQVSAQRLQEGHWPGDRLAQVELPEISRSSEFLIWSNYVIDRFLRNMAGYLFELSAIKANTLQRHNTETSKQIFPGKKLRCYSPNSYIHVSVSGLFLWSVCLFCCRKIGGSNVGNGYI
jgi:hypothetical protein